MSDESTTDKIVGIIDDMESLIASMSMPIPNDIHVKALKVSLPNLRDKLKNIYFEMGGEEIWD